MGHNEEHTTQGNNMQRKTWQRTKPINKGSMFLKIKINHNFTSLTSAHNKERSDLKHRCYAAIGKIVWNTFIT